MSCIKVGFDKTLCDKLLLHFKVFITIVLFGYNTVSTKLYLVTAATFLVNFVLFSMYSIHRFFKYVLFRSLRGPFLL